jgi:hypothetical protein
MLAAALAAPLFAEDATPSSDASASPTSPAVTPDDSSPIPNWVTPLTELDKKLPYWLQFTGQYRSRWEDPHALKFGLLDDGYYLGRFRFGVAIQPTHWLRFVGVTQDARIYFNQHVASTPPYQNRWDIWEAYAELGSMNEGWYDIKGGRQILSFGDERLVGPADWLNQGRTFDAVRLDLHDPSLDVAIFASSVVIARDGVIDHHLEGNNFHGIYGSFKRWVPKSTIEPYAFLRVAPATVKLNENEGKGALNEYTFGIRAAGAIPADFDYNVEMDRQMGSLGPYSIEAWAGHWNLGKKFGGVLKPRPFIEADYASGNRNPAGHDWNTFDQIYPSGHDKLDFTDQVGWRNIKEVRTGVEENPFRKWKFRQTFEDFWLASTHDALYNASGAVLVAAPKIPGSDHVGEELDIIFEYRWFRSDIVGFGYGRLFTGQFLNANTPGKDYNIPYVYSTWNF